MSTNSDTNPDNETEIISKNINVIDEKENEISNKMQQLEELKMSKQKLVDLLKEKETESAKLTKMYMSLRNQRTNSDTMQSSQSSLFEGNKENENEEEDEESNTLVNDLYLENKFNLAENDFDTLSLDNAKIGNNKLDAAYKHSPSDYLWIEMKKQLNMRENLRNKKKELEDLIQNENGKTASLLINSYMLNGENSDNNKESENNKEIDEEEDDDNEENDKDYFEESNNNDIINGYREFFLRTKNNSIVKQEEKPMDNNNKIISNEKISPKEVVRQKQENICPPEELIDDEIMRTRTENHHQIKQTEFENNVYLMKNDDFCKIDENKIEGVLLKSLPEKQNQKAIYDLSEKMDKFITNQQQLNESMNKNFQEFLTKQNESQRSFHNSSFMNMTSSNTTNNNNDQIQFQTQIQIQQLMFNLNAAYHEISVQRNEMTTIKENMKQMNARIEQLTSANKTFNSIGTFTEDNKKDEIKVTTTISVQDEHHHPRSRSVSTNNALPSYFYNRKSIEKNDTKNNNRNNFLSAHQSARHEAYYTDDFEEDEEDKRSNIINIKANQNQNITRKFSSNTSTTKSTESSSSIKNLTEFSSNNSSTFALNKNNNSLKSASGNKSNEFLIQRLVRMQQLTSQTSTTSSQNDEQEQISKRDTFDKMREKIYSEVATLISKNEKRPVWLLNIFKELQYLNDKNSRDQALKSIFNISNRKMSKANSFCSSSANINTNNKTNNNDLTKSENYDDDDDVITYNYRMRKSMEQDEDNSSSLNPFENDSLSNTVIFVKSSPSSRPTTNNNDNYNNDNYNNNNCKSSLQKQHNSSPITNNNDDDDEKSSISQEVKYLISKIISTIKFSSDDFESDDESDLDEPTKPYKYAKCDSQYLNNIIDKVISVLRQSNRHFDYLRLYQNQLSAYLKEALNKYNNKNLIDCMEDILIDISDILYNELTFYSIMNNSKLIKNNEFTDDSTSSLQSQDQLRKSHNLNLIKSLARNKDMNNVIETTSRSNSIATTTEDDDNNDYSSESTGEKVYYFDDSDDKLSVKASEMISKNAKASLDLLNRFKYLFKERNFNYLKACQDDEEAEKHTKIENQSDLSSSSSSSSSEDDEEEENLEKEENMTCKVVDINDIKLKDDDDVTKLLCEKPTELEKNEITIDDLPDQLDLKKLDALKNEKTNSQNSVQTPFMAILDNIIMDSITDDLVGNPDEMPKLIVPSEQQQEAETNVIENFNLNEDAGKSEDKESARSQKSESSNSDHFVIIDGNNGRSSVGENNHSDPEMVDVKKEIEKNGHQNDDENVDNDPNDTSK